MVYLARFCDLLDTYVRRVFEDSSREFARNSAGCYVCGKDIFGSRTFRDGFEKYILSKIPEKTGELPVNYYFLLGDCRPAENILLGLDGGVYRGAKFRYRLAEQDIKIDVRSFNRAADFVFSRFFRRKPPAPGNFFAISHTRLGSATLMAFMKNIFGNVNCRAVGGISGPGRCLLAANDEIEAAVKDKFRLNSMPEAEKIMTAVRQYVEECTGMHWGIYKNGIVGRKKQA